MNEAVNISFEPTAPVPLSSIGFDYTPFSDSTRTHILAERDNIRDLYVRSQQNFIEIGHALINVKERLPHGQFGPWLDAEFGWSPATARRFMQVAAEFPDIAHVEQFEPSALYALAANSVPDEIRERFIAQAESGQPVRLGEVKASLGKHRGPAATPTAIELVAEIVRLMVRADSGGGIRTKLGFGNEVRSSLFEQEIAEFCDDDQNHVAQVVDRFGKACCQAAQQFLNASG